MISAVIFESIPKIISTIGPAVLWGTVVLASIIVEAVTVSLVSIWFVPGAIIAMILALCKVTF